MKTKDRTPLPIPSPMHTSLRLLPALAFTFSAFAAESVPSGEFTRKQLTNEFWAEGANFGDFNKDGKMDIVYGPFWYEGPDFKKRHEFYPANTSFKRKKADGSDETVPGFEGALGTNNA